jgi:hypothetical protein
MVLGEDDGTFRVLYGQKVFRPTWEVKVDTQHEIQRHSLEDGPPVPGPLPLWFRVLVWLGIMVRK